jgi:hypothetical protein
MTTQANELLVQRDERPATTSRLGELLIGVGLIAILVVAILGRPGQGGAIAAAFFVVIIGLVVRFPTLLEDGTSTEAGVPAASSMRVALLLVVSIFGLLTVKVGWDVTGLEALRIDPSWAWVLGAALGGKAFQSFAEISGKGK